MITTKMTDVMQRYDTYKDSGVQWLGKIPGHWGVRKMKYCFVQRSEKNHPNETKLSATQSHGVIPQSMYEDNGNHVVDVNKNFDGLKLVKIGDFVIHLRSFQGGIAYAHYQGIISAAYTILIPTESEYTQYYRILFTSYPYIQLLKTCVTGIREGQNIDYSILSNKQIPLPPLPEQRLIVSYLDEKCEKLDKLVEAKERKIELLGEMKQRVISDAVTRGINPNVNLKETNIPWLPQVPEHWEVSKLKRFCKDNKVKNKENIESNVLSLSYGKIIRKQNLNEGLLPDNYEGYQIVQPGYIVMRLTDLQNDHRSLRTGLVKEKGIITSAYVGLIVENIDSEYTHLLLHSYDVAKVYYSMGGGLRQSMNYQDVANLPICIPPKEEQREIVSYISSRVEKIDTLVGKLREEIEHIKEYKQRLISDVVTGQIKVS